MPNIGLPIESFVVGSLVPKSFNVGCIWRAVDRFVDQELHSIAIIIIHFIVQMLRPWLNCDVQEDVAKESETGKVYRASVVDKKGHTVLVMRPANQVLIKLP